MSQAPDASGLQEPALHYAVPLGHTFDLNQGRVLPDAELAGRLASVRLLFLGEHHTDARSHAFQAQVLERLAASGREVRVALEMLPPGANAALEGWRSGALDEAAFLEQSQWYEHWGYPWAFYREVFRTIQRHGLPVQGVNVDESTRAAVREGRVADLPARLQEEIGDWQEVSAPHKAWLLSMIGAGHGGMDPEGDAFQRLYRIQRLWDRVMGLRAARMAESQGEEGITVLLIGSGHLAHKLGANLHAARESALPQLSAWDDVAGADRIVPPTGEGARASVRVPLGMADWVRLYDGETAAPGPPALTGVKLEAVPKGVAIRTLRSREGSPLAPLHAEDIVTTAAGQPVASPVALRLAVEAHPRGEPLALTVLRDGSEQTVTLLWPKDASHP